MLRSVASSLVVLVLACAVLVAGEGDGSASDGNTRDEVALLKLQLAAQQQQIEELRRQLNEQKSLLRLAIRDADRAAQAQAPAGPGEAIRQPASWSAMDTRDRRPATIASYSRSRSVCHTCSGANSNMEDCR